ncbi:MAG: hypothetical protein IKA06_02215 [Clostridia bacterium]|nr:hypothetical protein [Clostridia bacterium]
MEENSRFTAAFCSNTVGGFRMLDGARLEALKNDLELHITPAGLSFCQRQFRAERRDPLVGELRFLSALAHSAHRFAAPELTDLHFEDPHDARIWQDICRQRAVLSKNTPPTLSCVMRTATDYLARAGREVYHKNLYCATDEIVAAACRGKTPDLALGIGDISAAFMPKFTGEAPRVGQFLLALRKREALSLSCTVAHFLKANAAFSPIPVLAIGEEGLGVHLSALPFGAELDVIDLPDYDREQDTAGLVNACRNTVIFAVSETAVKPLLLCGAPVKLIGRVLGSGRIVLKDGIRMLLSLPQAFLAAWQGKRQAALTVPPSPVHGVPARITLTENETQLLAGVRAEHSVLPSLLHLLKALLLAGGDFKKASLAATLTLPCDAEGAALSLLLPYHRFASELSLPTASYHIAVKESAKPVLTVFLAAEKAGLPCKKQCNALSEALKKGDFAALRQIIYTADRGC